MNCSEAGRKINDFINDTLPLDETEALIKHIRQCPECREEMEIYYTVHYALDVLDNDKHAGNFDMGSQLEEKLSKKEFIIRSKHRWNKVFNVSLVLVSAILILMIVLHQFGPQEGTLIEQLNWLLEQMA